jgi:acyl CoA:acetate/3-ketoacid CoA transferase
MPFRPAVAPALKTMDPRLFQPAPMGLSEDMARLAREPHAKHGRARR